ncbi:MAG TPA: asparaginase, partial [Oculatellaceae cyanobacterium]
MTATRHPVQLPELSTRRESLIENRHWGWVALAKPLQRRLYCTPGAGQLATFFRSSAKPFQAFPLVAAGCADQLSTEELAVICASHTGSERHIALVQQILGKANLTPDALQCGPHPPLDDEARQKLREQGVSPTSVHNNCSGKHAGMLFYCRAAGLDTTSYLNPKHPLQQCIIEGLRRFSGVQEIPLAVDGCGAPVFYLPLSAMATLYAHLGSEAALAPIRQAMTAYPELVGGEGRVDTVIMQVSRGQLLAKVGADGVLCVSRVGQGEGLAVKLADGSNTVRDLAVVAILHRLGWLDEIAWQDTRLQP